MDIGKNCYPIILDLHHWLIDLLRDSRRNGHPAICIARLLVADISNMNILLRAALDSICGRSVFRKGPRSVDNMSSDEVTHANTQSLVANTTASFQTRFLSAPLQRVGTRWSGSVEKPLPVAMVSGSRLRWIPANFLGWDAVKGLLFAFGSRRDSIAMLEKTAAFVWP